MVIWKYIWAANGVLRKKAPRAMRALRGKTLGTVPFQPYFGCEESFLEVLSKLRFHATRLVADPLQLTPLQPLIIHHRSGKKGIHHRASDAEKEKKEGFHGGGVYFFLPCYGLWSGIEAWSMRRTKMTQNTRQIQRDKQSPWLLSTHETTKKKLWESLYPGWNSCTSPTLTAAIVL